MKRLVLAERCFPVDVVPSDMVDLGERNASLAVHLRQAAVVRLGVVRSCIACELHNLPAHVDDVAAFGCSPGRLDVDAQYRALDGLARESDTERFSVAANLAHDGCGAASLHFADGGAGIGIGEAAGEHGGGPIAQARFAHVVAQLAIAVGEAHDHVVAKGRLGVCVPFIYESLEGLFAAQALGLNHFVATAEDKHGDKRLHRILKSLLGVHARSFLCGELKVCGSC